jgi:hypothetical protein
MARTATFGPWRFKERLMRRILPVLFALTPFAAAADMHDALGTGILVNDTAYCSEMVDVDPELHIWNVVQAGGETLSTVGIAAEEVDCWFEKEISFSWEGQPTQLTLAACYAGDMVQPTIFAIDMFPEAPGEVTVWQQGVETPLRYFVCSAPD